MRVLLCAAIVLSLCVVTGCVYSYAPVNAGIVATEKGPYPVAPDNAVAATKEGRARAEGIILVGFGDASIKTAMQQGNITKVHHVDTEVLNVLGVYSRYETIVYGE